MNKPKTSKPISNLWKDLKHPNETTNSLSTNTRLVLTHIATTGLQIIKKKTKIIIGNRQNQNKINIERIYNIEMINTFVILVPQTKADALRKLEESNIQKKINKITYVFEMYCWHRILRVPWTKKRSNSSKHWF